MESLVGELPSIDTCREDDDKLMISFCGLQDYSALVCSPTPERSSLLLPSKKILERNYYELADFSRLLSWCISRESTNGLLERKQRRESRYKRETRSETISGTVLSRNG